MCGRYYRRSDKQRIAEAYRLGEIPFDLVLPDWDFNIAPTTFQPVIRDSRESRQRELVLMRWGLVPFFTKQLSDVKGISTINAKAEGIQKSPTWRTPFIKRRCLVPADGFYEWKRLDSKTRQPFAFQMVNHAPFAFAGLWDAWKAPDGSWLQSFSIITTDANELMAKVHTRMPVILHPRDYDRWLDRENDQPPVDLLRPFEAEQMSAAPCNPQVGNVKNNGPDMLNSA
ncbi:MAG TPA: SOS response-associated peptidase [Terracidiphilus sp.]|jgi:putative SOS response-associated peptidase YedK